MSHLVNGSMPHSMSLNVCHLIGRLVLLALVPFMALSCDVPYVGPAPEDEQTANVVFRIASFEQTDFDSPSTKALVDVSQLCSRINLVVYSGSTKVKSIAQKSSDDGFGTIGLSLAQGHYKVAIIAHSTDGSATVTELDKISFKSNVISDTFLYADEITIGDEAQTIDVQLRRVVAMFRLKLTQALPENIKQLKFYYTGGSSTLSANTGYGSVNSKQTVVLNVANGQTVFEVYTFPHAETGKLKMTITALDATQSALHERVFEEVPVTRNKVTQYTGDLFEGNTTETGETRITMKAETEWVGQDEYSF